MMHQRLNDRTSRRYHYRSRATRSRSLGCLRALGCLSLVAAAAVIVGVIAAPLLPALLLRAAGLSPSGTTDQIFSEPERGSLSAPLNAASVQTFTITAGGIGSYTVNAGASAYRLYAGTDAAGSPSARLEISEAGLNQICRERLALCQPGGAPVSIERIDLRPGGAVIYTSLSASQLGGGLMGAIGAVLRVDASGRRVRLVGADVEGQLYTLPEALFGYRPAELEQLINDVLFGAAIAAAGSNFRIDQIAIADETVTVSLR
jgi:hypothetical protein